MPALALARAAETAAQIADSELRQRALLDVVVCARSLRRPEWAIEAQARLGAGWPRTQALADALSRTLRERAELPEHAEIVAATRELERSLRDMPSWRPHHFLHPDAVRAVLAESWSLLGEDARCDQALGEMSQPVDRARAWAAASVRCYLRAPERAEALAYHALTLVKQADQPRLMEEVAEQLAAGAAGAGRPGAAMMVLRTGEALWPEPRAQVRLGARVGRGCARVGDEATAGSVWQRACLAADRVRGLDLETARALLQICAGQRQHFGASLARTTLLRMLDALMVLPFPPQPLPHDPWGLLVDFVLRNPELSTPLRDHLRRQGVVPPAWCFVLGQLELLGGSPERARQVARALQDSAEGGENEVEALWMAAILRLRLGDRHGGRRLVERVLATADPESRIELAGKSTGDLRLERVFVEELLSAQEPALALSVARLCLQAGLRMELLRQVAVHEALGGAPEDQVRELLLEAVAAASEALRANERLPARELAALVHSLHNVDKEAEAIELVKADAEVEAGLSVDLCLEHLWALARLIAAPEAARISRLLAERLEVTLGRITSPVHRVEALLRQAAAMQGPG